MGLAEFFIENAAVIFWLFVAVAAGVVEGLTCDLVSIWFVPGAVGAMLLSLFVPSVWWQIALFLVLSVAMLVLTKTVFKKYLPQHRADKLNADAVIGAHGIVQEEIDNLHSRGSVKVGALVWTARSYDDGIIIPEGTVVTVREIRGVKLICSADDKA